LEVQERFPGPKTSETALKCEDILSGDAGRIFLSPGNWSEAGRGLGWPLSGFAFNAEYLVSRGARCRPRDLLSAYWSLIRKTLDDPEVASPTEAKRRILDGLLEIQDGGELDGEDALAALESFRLQPGDELLHPYDRERSGWPTQTEIVWDGPLPVGVAVEIWRDDRIVASGISA